MTMICIDSGATDVSYLYCGVFGATNEIYLCCAGAIDDIYLYPFAFGASGANASGRGAKGYEYSSGSG